MKQRYSRPLIFSLRITMVMEDRSAGMVHLLSSAASLKESLARSQTRSDDMISILGSFDERLTMLEAAMRPTQVHFLAIAPLRHSATLLLCF